MRRPLSRFRVTQLIDEPTSTSCISYHRSNSGNKVGVGSGFSLSQRIRYAERPDLILGKPITVRYFAESKTQASKKKRNAKNFKDDTEDEAVMSLRFPTVKMVYEDGVRDV